MRKDFAIKTIILAICFASMLLTGCTRRFIITTGNGTQISAVGKPKLINGEFVFKDETGRTLRIPQGSVREVAPASMSSSSKNSNYLPTPTK